MDPLGDDLERTFWTARGGVVTASSAPQIRLVTFLSLFCSQREEGALARLGGSLDGRRPVQLAGHEEATAAGPSRRPRRGGPSRGGLAAADPPRAGRPARPLAPHGAPGPPRHAAARRAGHAVRAARQRGRLHPPARGPPVRAGPTQRGKHSPKARPASPGIPSVHTGPSPA